MKEWLRSCNVARGPGIFVAGGRGGRRPAGFGPCSCITPSIPLRGIVVFLIVSTRSVRLFLLRKIIHSVPLVSFSFVFLLKNSEDWE